MLWKIPPSNWVVEKFFSANNSSGNSRGENDITLISDSTQPIFTSSKLLIETVEQGVKYV